MKSTVAEKVWLICFSALVVLHIPYKPLHGQEQLPTRLKVNKSFITVWAPDEQGLVYVHGNSGAVESTSRATLQIINLTDNHKIPVSVNEDGGFQAKIKAVGGAKIKVLARNQQGERSYGTFTVPTDPNTQTDPDNQPQPQPCQSQSLQPQPQPLTNQQQLIISQPFPSSLTDVSPGDAAELAVIITVVNTNTGDIIAAKHIAGPTSAITGQTKVLEAIAKNIIAKCTTIIMLEFKRSFPGITKTPEKPKDNISPDSPSNSKPPLTEPQKNKPSSLDGNPAETNTKTQERPPQ
jgi:hypothetical protein